MSTKPGQLQVTVAGTMTYHALFANRGQMTNLNMKHPLMCLAWMLAAVTSLCVTAFAVAAEPPQNSSQTDRVAEFIAVIQHEGKPVAGAQVSFPFFAPQQTDATAPVSGYRYRYSLPFPATQARVSMVVRADGFAIEYWQAHIGAGTTTQVIELARESPLTGRIRDAGGRPLAQATLTAVFFPDSPELLMGNVVAVARTDSAGEFSLHGLRAGRQYRILIQTEKLSVANGERIVTAGNGPIDIVMNAAVPVKLAISGLRGPFPVEPQVGGMAKVPAVINRDARALAGLHAGLDKGVLEATLSAQPDLVPAIRAGNGLSSPAIFMDWLDPDTDTWLPVFSPRHVKVKDATHADLQFDQVPVGTIRISTTGLGLELVREVFGPMTVKAGVSPVIPVRVTPLR